MSPKLAILKGMFRLLPLDLRTSRPVSMVKGMAFRYVLGHDAIYNSHYHESTVDGPAVASAETMSESIFLGLKPKTVVDVGCGTGALLTALQAKSRQVLGFEYSSAARKYCQERNLDVRKFDLENDSLEENRAFDVAISMEVGEHLLEKAADR